MYRAELSLETLWISTHRTLGCVFRWLEQICIVVNCVIKATGSFVLLLSMNTSSLIDFTDLGFEELGLTSHGTNIIQDSSQYTKRRHLINLVNQLDLPPDEWIRGVHQLHAFDKDACEECVSNFCASYTECRVSSLRVACEYVVRDSTFDFLLRCKAADALGNLFYHLEILQDYMHNPKDDINFTVYVDCLHNMLYYPDFTEDLIEPLLDWVFTTKQVLWVQKYKLYKTLCDTHVTSTPLLVALGKTLVTSNALANFTVLCLQLTRFDDKFLRSILQRTKLHKDLKIKADVYDHLLNYPGLKKDALVELRKIGEGMKSLDSSQNVHMVSADVDGWLTYLTDPAIVKLTPEITFASTVKEMKEYFSSGSVTTGGVTLVGGGGGATNADKALEYALQRLELDNTVYGAKHLKLANVLIRVWWLIEKHPSSDELKKRLKEELIEMSETCSTGHLYRLMNVFSGYEGAYKALHVDASVELGSVLNKRVQQYMSTLTDDEQSLVMDAWMDQDERVLQRYLYKQLAVIHDELYADYVGQGIMEAQDFTTCYRDNVNKLFVK